MFTKHLIQASAIRLGFSVALLMFFLCACSGPSLSTGSTSTTGNPLTNMLATGTPMPATGTPVANAQLLAILPVLQKSLQAMQQLKSTRIEFQGKGTLQTSGALLPAFAHKTRYSLRGRADVDLSRQSGQAQVRLKLLPAHAQAASYTGVARLVSQKLYLQSSTQQPWLVLDVVSAIALLQAHVAGQVPPQNLLALVQGITVTDHGMIPMQGQQVRHVSLVINQKALGQLANTMQQQQAGQVLASVQVPTGIQADAFIDGATSRLVRLQVKGGLKINVDRLLAGSTQANMPATQGKQARALAITFDLSFLLSKFDQPVPQVVAPPGATPIDLTKLALP